MAKSSKKSKKLKLPKRIAGVKLPKAARKGPLADFLNSSGGQVLLAEALVLAAGVFGANKLRSSAAGKGARDTIEEASARLSHACSEALKAFRAALAEDTPVSAKSADRDTDDEDEPDVESLDDERARVKKKKRRYSSSETATATH